jgi:hypothetical protein
MAALRAAHGLDFTQCISHLRFDDLTVLHQGLPKGGHAHAEATAFKQAHAQRFLQ